MFQQFFGKAAEVFVKQSAKIIVAGVGTAIVGTASVISYNLGKKKGDKEGQKKASEIYEAKFRDIASMFD